MPPPETRNPPPAGTGEGQKASDSAKRLNRYGTARSVTNALLVTISDEELRPVSYTHLDVYKRQVLYLWFVSNESINCFRSIYLLPLCF